MAEKPTASDQAGTGTPQTVSQPEMKPCPTCGEPRPVNSETCPHCGVR